MKIINENLIIIELSKKKCVFDSPILIGSQILFNSKCNLYNYMFNIIPKLFSRENIMFGFRDTDSIIYKIKNCPYEKYLKTLEENSNLFGKHMGLMENEIDENINEVVSLRSKSNSIQKVSDINIKVDNNHKLRKSKDISNYYREKYHTHEYFKKILFNELNMKKTEYYKISLKDVKLITELQIKDDISNSNDKRYMVDNLTSKPHTINLQFIMIFTNISNTNTFQTIRIFHKIINRFNIKFFLISTKFYFYKHIPINFSVHKYIITISFIVFNTFSF